MLVVLSTYVSFQKFTGHDLSEPEEIGKLVIASSAASFGWLIYQVLFGSSTVRSEAAIAMPGSCPISISNLNIEQSMLTSD
jgi:hypothetical protein